MKIYIGNIEVAGYFMRLKDGFDKIQVRADLWFLINNKSYRSPSNWLLRLNQRLFMFFKRNKTPLRLPFAIPAVIGMFLIHTIVFVYALCKYDVFILNSQPFFNYAELAILKLFRKKIIVVFLGTESRPSYISGNLIYGRYRSESGFNLKRCYQNVQSQVRRIHRIETYADAIINHPPTALFQQKPFIAWLHVGFPNENHHRVSKSLDSSNIVKVLHAPSNAVSKGSGIIFEIISKLQAEGLPIEFVKLENVPNEKVIDELNDCDLVVDEVYSDIPIGGLGTEAAFAGKPVINGGYYESDIDRDYPINVIPPSCFCEPESLESELRALVLSKEKRQESGKKLHAFVTNQWDSATIAKKYMMIINGNMPQEWMYDPMRITYFYGYGIEKTLLKSFLKQYVEKFGEQALFLDDKHELKENLLSFIRSEARTQFNQNQKQAVGF